MSQWVRLLVMMLAFIAECHFQSWLLCFWSSSLQQMMVHVLEPLPPMWEAKLEFRLLASAWPNPSCCGHLWSEKADWTPSPFPFNLPLCVSFYLSNKIKIKKSFKKEGMEEGEGSQGREGKEGRGRGKKSRRTSSR